MRIVLICDIFAPKKNSAAVQLGDLTTEFVNQGYEVTVLVASDQLDKPFEKIQQGLLTIVNLKTPKVTDVSYVRRTFGEWRTPYVMIRQLKKLGIDLGQWKGVIWYSPTIFLSPVVKLIKRHSHCRTYLILRDIFPNWLVDLGIIRKGLIYYFFQYIAKKQYQLADTIGIQSPGNRVFLKDTAQHIEVLNNWLMKRPYRRSSLQIQQTRLKGRRIFVYAGNMGVAQGINILLELAQAYQQQKEIGFLFVGRGSEMKHLMLLANQRQLDNIMFHNEIDPSELPELYQQCEIGLLALDPRHKTHNIPGKFLSYMLCGLPVLATVNGGNDIISIIQSHQVGAVCDHPSVKSLKLLGDQLLVETTKGQIQKRCKALYDQYYQPHIAVSQIVCALSKKAQQTICSQPIYERK